MPTEKIHAGKSDPDDDASRHRRRSATAATAAATAAFESTAAQDEVANGDLARNDNDDDDDSRTAHSQHADQQRQQQFQQARAQLMDLVDAGAGLLRDLLRDHAQVPLATWGAASSAVRSQHQQQQQQQQWHLLDSDYGLLMQALGARRHSAPPGGLAVRIRDPVHSADADDSHENADTHQNQQQQQQQAHSEWLAMRYRDLIGHLDQIRQRMTDPASKVLVTGDVNAGKSSLINALMRNDVLPVDQQPCTPLLLEVVDSAVNQGREEVHAVKHMVTADANHDDDDNDSKGAYNVNDRNTYTAFDIATLKSISFAEDFESTADASGKYRQFVVYSQNQRPPAESLMNNGLVNVHWIDSPGLNRDTTKTMAVFAAQSDIDAVVFVVNAENHFTLSGMEFLQEAGKEKPYIFVCVNRFDVIHDKEKCRRRIMEQVKSLLPKSYAHAEELVHFISAKNVLLRLQSTVQAPSPSDFNFINFESCLRSFLIDKRMKSKLAPAHHFIDLLAQDLHRLFHQNIERARMRLEDLNQLLLIERPACDALDALTCTLQERIHTVTDETCHLIHQRARGTLEQCMANAGQWTSRIAPQSPLFLWTYAEAMIAESNRQLLKTLYKFEDGAIETTVQSARSLYSGIEPEMESHEILDASLTPIPALIRQMSPGEQSDLLNIQPHWTDFVEWPTQQSLVNWTVSSTSVMASCWLIGYRRVISGVRYTGQLIGLSGAQLFWGTVSVVGIGSAIVWLSDINDTTQRKITRKIRRQLRNSTSIHQQFHRVTYYSRKALDQASVQYQHVMMQASSARKSQLKKLSDQRETAEKRLLWLDTMQKRTEQLRSGLAVVNLLDPPPSTSSKPNGSIVTRFSSP